MRSHIELSSLLTAALLALFGAGAAAAQVTLTMDQSAINITAYQASGLPPAVVRTLQTNTGVAVPFTVSVSSGVPWLQVTQTNNTTPSNISFSVNQSGLAVGEHQAAVIITSPQASNILLIPVTLHVVAGAPSQVTPGALSFDFLTGSTAAQAQSLSLTSVASGQAFTAQADVPWLTVDPASGSSPAIIGVLVNPSGLAQGTHKGTVSIAVSGSGTPLTVPVTVNISPIPSLVLSRETVRFNYQIGGNVPAQQTQSIQVSSTGSALTYMTAASGGNWLVVTPGVGSTPGSVNIEVNAMALGAGTYQGVVTLTPIGASSGLRTIPVFLTVSTTPLLSLAPGELIFTHQLGGAAPVAQNVTPSSTGAELNYQAGTVIPSGGNWLMVSPPSGTTPNPISVSINPAGLSVGTYSATISVSSPGAGNTPQSIPVTLKVTSEPQLQLSAGRLTFAYQLGRSLPPAQIVTVTSTTAPLNVAAGAQTQSGGDWLFVSPSVGTTPAEFRVEVRTDGLQAGRYQGTILLTSPGAANSPQTLDVILHVSPNPLIILSRPNLNFVRQVADTTELQQIAITSTGDPLQFTVTPTVLSPQAATWLIVSPTAGTTPQPVNVVANPSGLPPGRYEARLEIRATSPAGSVANSPEIVPITLTVTTGALNVAPAVLTLTLPAGAPARTQEFQITSTGAPLNWTALASMNIGQGWLGVVDASGSTPGTLRVSVNASQLNPGTYAGSISVISPGAAGSPQLIPVTLTVTQPHNLTVSPAALAFGAQVGGPAPANQQIAVSASPGNVGFSAAATTTSGGNWLAVTPASGTTPANLTVSVNPQGLSPGSYSGRITVTAPNATNSPQVVEVTFNVAAIPVPQVLAVVNAASYLPGSIAPGEIVTIGGNNLGPVTGVTAQPQGGRFPTTLADVRVLFDGIPAAVWYVRADQINAIVPYAIAGRVTTRVQVESRGVLSPVLELRVADTAPGIFTAMGSGSGQAAALNQDYSGNSVANPAERGSVVMLYATGEGLSAPLPVDGAIAPADPALLWSPLAPVTVTIGGQRADVLYRGAAPGIVAGGLQINVRIPETVPAGQLPITVTMGNANTQPGLTIAVR